MINHDDIPGGLRCDCSYRCLGETAQEQARDAQRHAREVHGIDVAPDQVLRIAATRNQPKERP